MALAILSVLIYAGLKQDGARVIGPWDAVLSGAALSVLLPFGIIGVYLLPERRRGQFKRTLPLTIIAFAPVGIGQFYLKAAARYGALENYPAMEAAMSQCWIYFRIGFALLILSMLVYLCFSVWGWWHHLRSEKRVGGMSV
jgi:hypothetical protein